MESLLTLPSINSCPTLYSSFLLLLYLFFSSNAANTNQLRAQARTRWSYCHEPKQLQTQLKVNRKQGGRVLVQLAYSTAVSSFLQRPTMLNSKISLFLCLDPRIGTVFPLKWRALLLLFSNPFLCPGCVCSSSSLTKASNASFNFVSASCPTTLIFQTNRKKSDCL